MRRRLGLGAQVAVLAGVIALVTAAIAAVTAILLVRAPAETEARASLHREAQLVARFLDARQGLTTAPRAVGAVRVLQAEQVAIARVSSTGEITPSGSGITAAEAQQVLSTGSLKAVRRIGGERSFIDGVRLSDGGAVVLVQPSGSVKSLTQGLRRRIVGALAIAVALAVGAGVLLSRRITRPLRAVAASARSMATGHRGVTVPSGGSQEVDDVGLALAELDRALSVSEGRQREFLLSVSHELRTPLTSLRGFAESLADGVVPAEGTAAVGTTLVEEAERLDRLISDLLDLARLRADSFRITTAPTDLDEVLAATARVWSRRCADSGVTFTSGGVGHTVSTDAGRLRQVLDNLLENALRVTPASGAISVELDRTVLRVADTGPGLTDDDVRVAFEPGALHERYSGVRPVGTGVGLALAAGLVDRLGGTISVARRDPGAVFTVTIPDTTRTPT